MAIRAYRVAEQIKKELGDIINRKLKDPRINFITITGVDVTGDLQQAMVYFSTLGDEKEKEQTLHALEKAQGFIRSEIANRIRLRKAPELIFQLDKSVEQGSRIDALLRDLNKKD